MKLRLQIMTAPGCSTTFEHAGPVIRIGRDPECELALEGDAARQVSRQHVRIELAPEGATVRDDGSSNGTLLNDRLIEKPMSLHAGDRLQLGYTGATLTVVDLDLTPHAAAPTAASPLRVVGIGAGVVVGSVLLLALVFGLVLAMSRNRPGRDGSGQTDGKDVAVLPLTDKDRDAKESDGKDKDAKDGGRKDTGAKDKPPPPPPPIPVPPASVEIGRYVSLEKLWGPSVLLARQGDAYPWAPLRPEGKVATGHMLVSLPGYRSQIGLDTGVELTLWGNVPEFSAFPPVLESVVLLEPPTVGVDLDVTLDHGRIVLANRKKKGAAQVRLRFLGEVWDLALPAPGSEIALELWGLPTSATPGMTSTPTICVGLFTKGRATLQTPQQKLDLGERTRLTWLGPPGKLFDPIALPQLPDWWVKPPDRTNPHVQDVMISLSDWSQDLARSSDVLDTILTRVKEPKDPTQRMVGLLFLAALDGAAYLVDFLEDRPHPEVRGTTAHALRCRLARGADQPSDLEELLKKRRGYAKEKAALIVQLLQNLPEDELGKPAIYQLLIGWLDHENLAIRDLAFWHLALLAPEGAKKIAYNPTSEAAERQKAIVQWKKFIPEGSVPRRPPRK